MSARTVEGDEVGPVVEFEHPDVSAGDTAPTLHADVPGTARTPRKRWLDRIAFGLLPALVLLITLGVGYLTWYADSAASAERDDRESLRAATDATVAMLSYRPDNVEANLTAVSEQLTGSFRDEYNSLTHDVVIPGAIQKGITANATVTAAAPISATDTSAVVLLFVNQTTAVGQDPPTDTASVVRVTLVQSDGRWRISKFEPL